jgi:hypothetical protein
MKLIHLLAFTLAFLGLQSQAGDQQGDGIEAAGKYCNTLMNFSSDKTKCRAIVKDVKFVDIRALDICRKNANFPSDQMKCLQSIVSKQFRDYEITACGQESFVSDTIKCLKSAGTEFVVAEPSKAAPAQAAVTVDQALDTMRAARSLLQAGSQVQAFKTLDDFLNRAEVKDAKKSP